MGCLGGIGTSAELAVFLGFSVGKNVLVGGVGREIRDKLYEDGGFSPASKAVLATSIRRNCERCCANTRPTCLNIEEE